MLEQKELIEACVKGDRKAQKELYDRYSRGMYVVCLRYAKSDQEAEDILQDSFIKVFKHLGKFRGESRLEYWIKRVVVNTALNYTRNKLYMYPMVDVEDVTQEFDYEQILSNYHFEELLKFISELPQGCRIVFNLFAIEGYSHQEIADMLDISEGTSKSQYFRAKKLLQNRISEDQVSPYEGYK
jgi:RNA polymerase sigma-70 factor (ECF subfamily)